MNIPTFELIIYFMTIGFILLVLIINKKIDKNKDIKEKIFKSIIKNNITAIKKYIESGGDINIKDKYGDNMLIKASIFGKTDIIKLLLENGINVNSKDSTGKTPLMYASENGYIEIVKILLKNGANINIQDNFKWTALMHAVFYGHKDIVKLLLKNGADVNIKNNEGNTALIYASKNGYIKKIKISDLISFKGHYGHTEIVELLLKNGADVNIKNNIGKTAIDYAKKNGYKNIVNLLKQFKK